MNGDSFIFWQRWLTISNCFGLLIGLLIAFAGDSFFFAIHNKFSANLFFGKQAFSPEVLHFKKFLFGIIGGVLVGYHSMIILISEYAFKRKEKWAYWAVFVGLTAWFVIDSSLSLYHGVYHNLYLINVPSYILFMLPLIFTRHSEWK